MQEALEKFYEWFELAKADEKEPTAMSLATVGDGGKPSLRTVLLKAADERGFVFYTNETSRKGRELEQNPHAALCFYWPSIGRQVRIEGAVERVSQDEADAYFATRLHHSQIGAWASKQSAPLANEAELKQRFAKYEKKFGAGPVPRPPFWGAYRVVPTRLEFWTVGEFRLHERVLFEIQGGVWKESLLFP